MATFRKRGKVWEAQVAKQGVRKSASFATKLEAQAWAARTEVSIAAGNATGIADKTFGDVLLRYLSEVSPRKRGFRWEELRITMYLRDPIAQVHLRDLNESHFAAWRDMRLKEVSPATVLRDWNLISNALKYARDEWKWMVSNPIRTVRKPPKSAARDRRVTEDEISRLMHVFGTRKDTVIGRVGQAFLFAIETAMRASEIAKLQWDDVYLDRKFCLIGEGKTAAARRGVPLTASAVEILRYIGTSKGPVFDIDTRQIDAHFRKARAKALIEDLHFHDSRHEAITRLAQRLNILDLARMVGHKDLRMLQIYYNSTPEEIATRL